MAKPIDAIFDPNSTWKPIEEGEYPAHIKSLTTKEVNTKAGEAIVVNMTYKVADEEYLLLMVKENKQLLTVDIL